MRVLLVVGYTDSLFSSGIAQQVYFTRMTLRAAGIDSEVAAVTPPLEAYAEVGVHTWQLFADTDINGFDAAIFVSTNLIATAPGSEPFFQRMKARGVKVVSMLCGNYFYLLQEQFVFQKHTQHNLAGSLNNPYIDEYWALETYQSYRPFIEALTDKPVRVLPYCWSRDVMDRFCDKRKLDPCHSSGRSEGLRIVIAEPNVSVHKTALVPLLIANRMIGELDKQGIGAKVMVLGGKDVDHTVVSKFLPIYEQGRVEVYPRMNLFHVLSELKDKSHPVIFISHQIDNGLNFLHFEATTLGYPIVHNSDQLQGTGGYYRDNDIDTGVEKALAFALESATAASRRQKRDAEVLQSFAPEHDRLIKGYLDTLGSLVT